MSQREGRKVKRESECGENTKKIHLMHAIISDV